MELSSFSIALITGILLVSVPFGILIVNAMRRDKQDNNTVREDPTTTPAQKTKPPEEPRKGFWGGWMRGLLRIALIALLGVIAIFVVTLSMYPDVLSFRPSIGNVSGGFLLGLLLLIGSRFLSKKKRETERTIVKFAGLIIIVITFAFSGFGHYTATKIEQLNACAWANDKATCDNINPSSRMSTYAARADNDVIGTLPTITLKARTWSKPYLYFTNSCIDWFVPKLNNVDVRVQYHKDGWWYDGYVPTGDAVRFLLLKSGVLHTTRYDVSSGKCSLY